MLQKPVYIPLVLFISLALGGMSTSVAEVKLISQGSDNAFTRSLLPGFARPTLQGQVSTFAEAGGEADPRFSLKPVRGHLNGKGAIEEPAVVDNLLRFRF